MPSKFLAMGKKLFFQLALTQVPLVGAVTAKQIISYCGSAEAAFRTSRKQLLKIPGIGEQTAQAIQEFRDFDRIEKEIAFLERTGIRALFYTDADYPDRLKHYPDAPVLLFMRGPASLNYQRTLAVVGTRQPSPQGIAICEEIISSLKPYDVQIVSGLAYGIDAAAHQAALQSSLPTIAVLGHGLNRIYPLSHKSLAEEMVRQSGGLLTEFLSEKGPDRENFPMRNRIVAAMSDALLVVETGARGGSMITANLANDYNKDVFAIPGRVKDPKSEGCNLLIKSHKAGLVESAEDIAYFMRWEHTQTKPPSTQGTLFADLEPKEKMILEMIRQETSPWSMDKISYHAQLPGSEIASVLLNLEFKGLVKSLPGKRFIPV